MNAHRNNIIKKLCKNVTSCCVSAKSKGIGKRIDLHKSSACKAYSTCKKTGHLSQLFNVIVTRNSIQSNF